MSKIDKCELPTFYWLPKLHKRPYKSRFISNSSHCSTTILSKHITSALTAVKNHVMKYSETAFSKSNVNYFAPLKTLPMSSKSRKGRIFLATRNMTRIDVGLVRSYVKLFLSSWKTYMCNLVAWYINK